MSSMRWVLDMEARIEQNTKEVLELQGRTTALELMLEALGRELDEQTQRVQALESNQEILRKFTPGL